MSRFSAFLYRRVYNLWDIIICAEVFSLLIDRDGVIEQYPSLRIQNIEQA
jgi:hypothetical protein